MSLAECSFSEFYKILILAFGTLAKSQFIDCVVTGVLDSI